MGASGYSYVAQLGGDNVGSTVGTSVVLGTVTVDTTGMDEGDYIVQIDYHTEDL